MPILPPIDIGQPNNPAKENNPDSRRARLSPKPGGRELIYGKMSSNLSGSNNQNIISDILSPLRQTNGLVWPYQPSINYQQSVDYSSVPLVHTNQDFYAFTRSPTPELSVEGEFTVQNKSEGLYVIACLHFLRTVTKMYFGKGDYLGVPPPVLLFNAYGKYMFNQLPVIVTNFTANMPSDVDYVPIPEGFVGYDLSLLDFSDTTGFNKDYFWLPSKFSISVSMKIQNTPARLREFNLDDFRTGKLLKEGGWI